MPELPHTTPLASLLFAGEGELARLCREKDWSTTPLGPVDAWPQSLRTAAALVVQNAFPMMLAWGPELVQIYNDRYRELLGNKHPAGLGQPVPVCWSEVWPEIQPMFGRAQSGESVYLEDLPLTVWRGDGPDKAWFTFSYSPVRDERGGVVGVLDTVVETTREVALRGAQAEVREGAARDAFRVALADALRSVADPVEVQFQAARVLGEHLGVTRVSYFQVVGDDFVVEREYIRDVPALVGRYPVESFGPALLRAYTAGETAWGEDVMADETLTPEARAAFDAIQIGAFIGAPLIKDGAFVAGLAVHHARARPWTPGERALVEETAERTWAAVEQARAEAALRESEAKYRLIFDSIDEGLAVVEMIFDAGGRPVDYRFLEVNRLFEEQTGLTAPTGRTAGELVPGLEPFWFETYGRVALTGEPTRFENGSEPMGRWFDVFAFRVGEPERRQVGILFRDVSVARAATRERERLLAESEAARGEAVDARAEAEAANRAKGEFLAVMSHELRTPLNAIGGYTDLLEMEIRGPVTPAQRADLARIKSSQRHLLGLINEVLNYARLESGRVDYDLGPVAASGAAAEAHALVAPQAGARGLELVVEPCRPAELVVMADAEKLRQILVNLLSNAVKFTPAGGRVEVRCEALDAWVRFIVRDTGIGIAADKLDSIFDPFVQVRSDFSRPSEGAGLGLAISRDLARGMGGELRAESAQGQGSTFILTLPSTP